MKPPLQANVEANIEPFSEYKTALRRSEVGQVDGKNDKAQAGRAKVHWQAIYKLFLEAEVSLKKTPKRASGMAYNVRAKPTCDTVLIPVVDCIRGLVVADIRLLTHSFRLSHGCKGFETPNKLPYSEPYDPLAGARRLTSAVGLTGLRHGRPYKSSPL